MFADICSAANPFIITIMAAAVANRSQIRDMLYYLYAHLSTFLVHCMIVADSTWDVLQYRVS